jgi:hypothetical protein
LQQLDAPQAVEAEFALQGAIQSRGREALTMWVQLQGKRVHERQQRLGRSIGALDDIRLVRLIGHHPLHVFGAQRFPLREYHPPRDAVKGTVKLTASEPIQETQRSKSSRLRS